MSQTFEPALLVFHGTGSADMGRSELWRIISCAFASPGLVFLLESRSLLGKVFHINVRTVLCGTMWVQVFSRESFLNPGQTMSLGNLQRVIWKHF